MFHTVNNSAMTDGYNYSPPPTLHVQNSCCYQIAMYTNVFSCKMNPFKIAERGTKTSGFVFTEGSTTDSKFVFVSGSEADVRLAEIELLELMKQCNGTVLRRIDLNKPTPSTPKTKQPKLPEDKFRQKKKAKGEANPPIPVAVMKNLKEMYMEYLAKGEL